MNLENIYRSPLILGFIAILVFNSCDLFNPDDSPPAVSIVYPVDGAYLTEPDTIRAIAVDNKEIKSVAFYIDGSEIGEDRKEPYEFYWDVSYWADQELHGLLAIAADQASNQSLSNMVTVRVSSGARIWPEIISPTEDSVFVGVDQVSFNWHQVRGAEMYLLAVAKDPHFEQFVTSFNCSDTAFTVSDLESGRYYWRVCGMNSIGRKSGWSVSRRFSVVMNPTDFLVFEEYPYNPILSGEHDWNYKAITGPCVLLENGLYKMWFAARGSSFHQLGYATSSDGIHWSIYSEPVLGPGVQGSFEEIEVRYPYVLKVNSTYYIWYCGYSSEEIWQIGLAQSADGITWEKYGGNPVLSVGPPGSVDEGGVSKCSVLFIEDTFHMWYTGVEVGGGRGSGICYATSSDGINWIKSSANPVMVNDPDLYWESTGLGGPCVVKVSASNYDMFYMSKVGDNISVNRARSSDGINWIKDPLNPIIPPGVEGSWNQYSSGGPNVLLTSDGTQQYRIWYTGNGYGTYWYIGYGVAKPLVSIQ